MSAALRPEPSADALFTEHDAAPSKPRVDTQER